LSDGYILHTSKSTIHPGDKNSSGDEHLDATAAEVPFNCLQGHSSGRNEEIWHYCRWCAPQLPTGALKRQKWRNLALLPLKCPSTTYRGTQAAEMKKSGIIAAEVPFNYLQGHSNGRNKEIWHYCRWSALQLPTGAL